MSCEKACYEADVNACGDITVKAGLESSTDYYATLTKNNSHYTDQRLITTGIDSSLVLPQRTYPAGYFNAGGYFNLTIRLASDYTLRPFTFNSIPYGCILFHTIITNTDSDDTSPLSIIQ